MLVFDLNSLDDETLSTLKEHGFDTIPLASLAEHVKQHCLDPTRNHIKGVIELPPIQTISKLPKPGDPDRKRLEALGNAAIEAGQVGIVILNGAMRFCSRTAIVWMPDDNRTRTKRIQKIHKVT